MRVVADSHIVYWYLGEWEHLSESALQCLAAAEDDEGIIVSALTIPELWMASTRKKAQRAVRLVGYGEIKAVLIDPTTTISVEPFGSDMWHYFERAAAVLPDPFDAAIVATALVLDAPLVTVDRAIIATNLVKTIS